MNDRMVQGSLLHFRMAAFICAVNHMHVGNTSRFQSAKDVDTQWTLAHCDAGRTLLQTKRQNLQEQECRSDQSPQPDSVSTPANNAGMGALIVQQVTHMMLSILTGTLSGTWSVSGLTGSPWVERLRSYAAASEGNTKSPHTSVRKKGCLSNKERLITSCPRPASRAEPRAPSA